jgi:hypothetical protein
LKEEHLLTFVGDLVMGRDSRRGDGWVSLSGSADDIYRVKKKGSLTSHATSKRRWL